MEDRISNLFEKFVNRQANEAEREELFALLRSARHDAQFLALIDRLYAEFTPQDNPFSASTEAAMLRAAFAADNTPKVRRLWPRIAAAASIVLALSAGGYFLLQKHQPKQQTAAILKHDVSPGGTQAILTLSNGKKIVLNNQKGRIASQGNTNILLNAKGAVNYQAIANHQPGEEIYNTLTVPIGNHRDMTLADGTEVSLDAGSSITYPVAFTGKERSVSITGQVYFKVKHDAAHPFSTTVKGLTIQDIGTEFNINAYDDEDAVKTTLVEGSVTVNNTLLKPGQQAIAGNNTIQLKEANVEAVTAWKNNDFYFDNQSLKSSMRQIARWYNVKVVYTNVDERLKLFVDVTRATNLSVVLRAIENTGKVKCSLNGNTVTLSQPN